MKWRLMLALPRSGAENMARDTGLMDRARDTGESVFSVYAWERPTLSLGRNQAAKGKYDLNLIQSRGMDVVRRPTGGRALLHHREVTYSVTAPIGKAGSLTDSYARINAIILDGLLSLGVNAMEAERPGRSRAPGDVPCFAEPAKGELTTDGRKLVGSAQVRENGALLQHGSILIEDDQALIAAVLLSPPSRDAAAAATLARALGRTPSTEEVARALFAAVKKLEDSAANTIDEFEMQAATAHHLGRYTNERWTWRR